MKPSSGHWNGPSDKSPASPSAALTPPGASGSGNASSAKPLRISIIIPTFNEASTIEDCLGQFDCGAGDSSGADGPGGRGDPGGSSGAEGPGELDAPGGPDAPEIIVVDGGSDDETAGIARSCPGVRLIESATRGRAVQMNAGAAASSGNVLLFLHADTRLPAGWRDLVTRSIRSSGKPAGRFRFDIDHGSRIYRWIARGTNFRSRTLGITYGDQAIYATREAFERVGGFPEIPVFEDARFADRLKQNGGLDWIDEAVLTSARRWERRGPVRTLLLTWLLRLLYTLFVPPRFLARFYGVVR